jgi:hypothetical protein
MSFEAGEAQLRRGAGGRESGGPARGPGAGARMLKGLRATSQISEAHDRSKLGLGGLS